MHTLKIENITLAYDKQEVIHNLSLHVPDHKITVLVGANGCGKSTLLKSIARIIKPKKGSIAFDGQQLCAYKEKDIARKIAFLPQEPICPSGISIQELVSFGRYPHIKSGQGLSQYDYEIIEWAIDKTGLNDIKDKAIDELSGGQRQRAWIAMTLAQETDIILLDEPTTFLDMSFQLEILELIKQLNQEQNKTFVIVLHDINQACRFADHIVGMKAGEILFEGTPMDVITVDNLKDIYGILANLSIHTEKRYPICTSYELMV